MTYTQVKAIQENLIRAYYANAPQSYVDTHRQILANAGLRDWLKSVPEIALELALDKILAKPLPEKMPKRFPNVQ